MLATRRTIAGGGAATLMAGAARAQAAPGGWPSGELIPLWPGAIPGAGAARPQPKVTDKVNDPARPFRLLTGVDRPMMQVLRAVKPDGSAMLVIPGGGYQLLAWDIEGLEPAAWLNARGTTVFILLHRLPAEGWADRARAPLQDAQRAMRLIRSRAAGFGVDPARVGVLGFSAGGHLAGSLATRHGEAAYGSVDAADRLSARPDLAALIYPVVSLQPPFGHAPSAEKLLGAGAAPEALAAASVERRVDAETPPLFLVHAADDDGVDPRNSLALYAAALGARVPAELHMFEKGGHGFGLRLPPASPAAAWPEMLARMARARGVFR